MTMKLSIENIPGTPINVDLIRYIERRSDSALALVRAHVRQLQVGLLALDDRPGKADCRCRIQLLLEGEAPLVVTETSRDQTAAINRALSVAGQLAELRIGLRAHSEPLGRGPV